jgi:hypothetical protein
MQAQKLSTRSARPTFRGVQTRTARPVVKCNAQSSNTETEIKPGVFEGWVGRLKGTRLEKTMQQRAALLSRFLWCEGVGECHRPAAAPSCAHAYTTNNNNRYWKWNGHDIRYQRSGDAGPAVLMVHGFGGNADHWRKNTPVLGAAGHRAFAIDLLGYGYSSKPDPRSAPSNAIYCFETWGRQLVDFIGEKIGAETTITSNSVGGEPTEWLAGCGGLFCSSRVVEGSEGCPE